jgi:hypothetical protein
MEMSGWIQAHVALIRKETSHCTYCIEEWVGPESAWMLWKRCKRVAVAGILTPIVENAPILNLFTVMRQRRNGKL